MNFSSRLNIRQALAVALFITLIGAGTPNLQAQKKSHGQGCVEETPAQSCPQTLREKPTAPPAESCCPVDPKDVKKAQKEADKQGHEAAKACKKQQEAAMKAQRKIDNAYEKGNRKVDAANAKLEKEKADSAEANARLESLQSAREQSASVTTRSEQSESAMRSKPEPETMAPSMPAPEAQQPSVSSETPSTAQAPTPVPAPAPEAATPAPAPAPEATQAMSEQTQPKELPKTASPLELLGLIGLASSITGYVTRRLRG